MIYSDLDHTIIVMIIIIIIVVVGVAVPTISRKTDLLNYVCQTADAM